MAIKIKRNPRKEKRPESKAVTEEVETSGNGKVESLDIASEEPLLIDVPHIEITGEDLPSRFLPYPKGTRIFYRPYTYGEIDTAVSSKAAYDKGLRHVLQGIIVEGMDKNDLTLNDFLYLALLRKISSLGTTDFVVQVTPVDLGTPITKRMKTQDIEFQNLEVPKLPVRVKLGGKELHFRPLTIGKYMDLVRGVFMEVAEPSTEEAETPEEEEEMLRAGGEVAEVSRGDMPNERQMMAASCCNLEFNDAYRTISNAIAGEMTRLHKVDKILFHGVKPLDIDYAVTSEKDGKKIRNVRRARVLLDNPYTLVWPFRESGESDGDSIQFGLPGDS